MILCLIFFPAPYGLQAGVTDKNFLTLSDIHYGQNRIKTTYDQVTGKQLLTNAFLKLADVTHDTHPGFIIYLGDLPGFPITRTALFSENHTVLAKLRELAGVNIPLFYVPGNEDSPGGDYHSFTDASGQTPLSSDPGHSWPGINAAANCRHSPHQACIPGLPYQNKFGYYSAYPLGTKSHLELIVLNSIIFSPFYKEDDHVSQRIAAQKEISWFRQQLQRAERNHNAVIIALHIPPGYDSYANRPMWTKSIKLADHRTIQENFLALINQYHTIIKIILAAHTHFDQIRLIENSSGEIHAVVAFTPGITPAHGNNPGFKLYYYDAKNDDIMNAVTYYSTPAAPVWGNDSRDFHTLYHCQSHQTILACLATLSPGSIIKSMERGFAVYAPNFIPPQGWKAIAANIPLKY